MPESEHVDPTGLIDSHLVELRGPDGTLKDSSGTPTATASPNAKGPAEVFLFVREAEGGWRYEIEDRAGTVLSKGTTYPNQESALTAANVWTEGIENISTVEVHAPWPEATDGAPDHSVELSALQDKLAALQGDDPA